MTDPEAFSSIVEDCLKTSTEALAELKKFKSYIAETAPQTTDGISFYDVKNREMLAYLTDISYLMTKMAVGDSIEGDTAVDRLLKRRVVLEKIRPIEAKLRPQVDRLIGAKKTPGEGGESAMRARLDQFVIDDDADDDDAANGDEDKEDDDKNKKYVPPKIRALQYEGDEFEKEARRQERIRKRMNQSSLIRDLHAQYSEAPEEVFDDYRERESKSEADRRRYEESHMVRLQVTKKERVAESKKRQLNDLDTLLNFGDYMADGLKIDRKRKHEGGRPNGKGGKGGKGRPNGKRPKKGPPAKKRKTGGRRK
uniref:Neuroguidin n=1 Tax=Panagrellus redivivus TaxID=6233 RepID=A0A7E4V2H5_PANRE